MTLRELSIGDQFYPKSKVGKSTPIFEVVGLPVFNMRHGRATRMCKNRKTGEQVSKSCSLEIIKTTKPIQQ